jgi:hypothetical protein
MPSVMMDSTEAYFGGAEIDRGKTMHSDNAHISDPGVDDAGAGERLYILFKLVFRVL